MKYTGTSTRASCHVQLQLPSLLTSGTTSECASLERTRGFLMLCFIARRPLTYHVIIININRKELYDFYYTAITYN